MLNNVSLPFCGIHKTFALFNKSVDITNLSYQSLNEFLNQSKQETIERCDEEKKFWELEKKEIHNYSKEQAINKLIDSLKINQKIEQIDKYQKDLLK